MLSVLSFYYYQDIPGLNGHGVARGNQVKQGPIEQLKEGGQVRSIRIRTTGSKNSPRVLPPDTRPPIQESRFLAKWDPVLTAMGAGPGLQE